MLSFQREVYNPLQPPKNFTTMTSPSQAAASLERSRNHPENPGVHRTWKQYKCACGSTMSSRDGFIYYCSICNERAEKLARQTINCSPYNSMAPSILANASNPVSMSLGMAAGPMIPLPGNYQQLSTVNDSFRAFINAEAAAARDIPNITLPSPAHQLSKTALLQKDTMTGTNSNNASLRKSVGSSLSGRALGNGMSGRWGGSNFQGMYNNLNVSGGSYGSAAGYGGGMEQLSDPMNAPYGGKMYNMNNADGMLVGEVNNNVLVESQMNVQSEKCDKLITRDFLGLLGNGMNSLSSGMEYLSDPMNAPYGEMMYNVYNADGMLVGEVNNNVVVEPQMNVQNENCDTRDFLGLMENGMSSLSGGGMVADHNGNGMVTNSPHNEATTSAEDRPSVRGF